MKSLSILLLLAALWSSSVSGQEVISHHPVKTPEAIRAALFELPEADSAVFIRFDLPQSEYLTIRMRDVTAWKSKNLPDIVALAAQLQRQLADSFTDATASRRLAVSVPEAGGILTQLTESGGGARTVLVNGTQVQSIRIASDTLTVVQGDADQKVLFTFFLKDLSRIQDLNQNKALVQRMVLGVDSLIASRLQKWRRPASQTHLVQARYNFMAPAGTEPVLTLGTTSTIRENIVYGGDLGISFLAGKIASYINYKLSYQWIGKRYRLNQYAAVSYSNLILYADENGSLSGRVLQFINAEVGVENRTRKGFSFQQTSIGVGYRVVGVNTGPYEYRYRVFLNYGLSPALTVTPDFYFSGRRSDNSTSSNPALAAGAITLSVRIF
ncbi:MAG: hypothetical protein EOP52_03735 [Sphingobacteriales bacterium]|nr:MAG: hypothetical protein EOP52_03735 [Sphingobacteriales bacterium]